MAGAETEEEGGAFVETDVGQSQHVLLIHFQNLKALQKFLQKYNRTTRSNQKTTKSNWKSLHLEMNRARPFQQKPIPQNTKIIYIYTEFDRDNQGIGRRSQRASYLHRKEVAALEEEARGSHAVLAIVDDPRETKLFGEQMAHLRFQRSHALS